MYALRWFTPGGEVNLCGHATLAASFALWEEGMVDPATAIRFSTASGVLTCRRDEEGWVEMDFPAQARWLLPPRAHHFTSRRGVSPLAATKASVSLHSGCRATK